LLSNRGCMIKRLKVSNFLSLKDIDVEFGPRNVLIGPNMSGKSNLIDCFRFLTEIIKQPSPQTALWTAVSNRGGFDEILWKGASERRVTFELTVELSPSGKSARSTRYDYRVSISDINNISYLDIDEETLTSNSTGSAQTILEANSKETRIDLGDGKIEKTNGKLAQQSTLWRTTSNSECGRFRDFVLDWRFYNLIPALMREGNAPEPEARLDAQGKNFSSWLLTLQLYPDFERIKQVCRDVLPDMAEMLFQPNPSKNISVSTRERYFEGNFPISRMSDGELAFAALMSLILAPKTLTPPLLCVEEPENYLHPKLLETVVEVLNQRALELGNQASQIVATTHSPYLVDKLNIEDLIVAEKEKGATKFTRPSSKRKLRELLSRREMGLGELWYSGALSDT
jgi:predicted ATPase